MTHHDQLQAAAEAAFREGYDAGYNNGSSDASTFEFGGGSKGAATRKKDQDQAWADSDAAARHFPAPSQDEAVLRERFEAWASSRMDLQREGDSYHAYRTRRTWEIWQAAYLAASRPAWMPIASAPKDGTRILFYDPQSSGLVHTGIWDAKFDSKFNKETEELEYRGAWTDFSVQSFGYEELNEFQPTHWQPLPAPPTA